jgi:hypothetical protein
MMYKEIIDQIAREYNMNPEGFDFANEKDMFIDTLKSCVVSGLNLAVRKETKSKFSVAKIYRKAAKEKMIAGCVRLIIEIGKIGHPYYAAMHLIEENKIENSTIAKMKKRAEKMISDLENLSLENDTVKIMDIFAKLGAICIHGTEITE